MNMLGHDLFYWQLLSNLAIDHHMRLIEINRENQEIWLEHESPTKRKVIRVKRVDIDWANWVKQDVKKVESVAALLRKQLGLRELIVENVYVTIFPPVDFLELDEADGKHRTTVLTTLIEQESSMKREAVEKLYSRWNLPIPNLDAWDQEDPSIIEELQQKVRKSVTEKQAAEKALFTFGKPLLTYLLLLINGVMFAVLERNGGSMDLITLIEYGAKYNRLIEEGEYWRFFSSMFLHIGFLHFFMNSLALLFLGSFVERIYGTLRFAIIYFVAGLFGSVVSFAFHEQVSAGASGAIFGCFGALLYFGLIHRTLFLRTIGKSVIYILALNLAFGFMVPMIDNAAHMGGLIGGFLASSFLHLPKHIQRIKQAAFLASTCIVLFALLKFGFIHEPKQGFPLVDLQIAQLLLEEEEVGKAHLILQDIVINKQVNMPEAHFLLAYAQVDLGEYEEAKTHLLKALELRSTFHEAYYNLALVYTELDELAQAIEAIDNAIQLQPKEPLYLQLKDKLNELTGDRLE